MSEIFDAPDQVIDQLVDTDPQETAEWHASFDSTLAHAGPVRARYLMLSLLERAREKNVGLPYLRTTDYINTIPPEREPAFPGDEAIEKRIRAFIRWNAAMLVQRAQRPGVGVGGHISTYASSAALYEVGFNHFFRGKDHPGGGDQIYFQGHASPGMYARAFIEGRFTENQLDGFRQELSHEGGGLSSYPHPRLMPEFWEFPTVSMGLGPINAIYQARFADLAVPLDERGRDQPDPGAGRRADRLDDVARGVSPGALSRLRLQARFRHAGVPRGELGRGDVARLAIAAPDGAHAHLHRALRLAGRI